MAGGSIELHGNAHVLPMCRALGPALFGSLYAGLTQMSPY